MKTVRVYVCVALVLWAVVPLRATPLDQMLIDTNYVLGADDTIMISVIQAPEISDNKPIRIDLGGHIALPYVGELQAAGLTTSQLRQELMGRLTSIIKQPQVFVSVIDVNSRPVSILGAVNSPGVHQIRGRKLLTEMLSVAGGLRQDAGAAVLITRRSGQGPIPLPSAKKDATGEFYIASIGLKDLVGARHPEEDVVVLAHDVISIPVAEMVYVMGEVLRPGGFLLGERSHISLTEALALAGGLNRIANPKGSKLLRRISSVNGTRPELNIDIRRILQGKDKDLQIEAQDIVYVPGSTAKAVRLRAIEAAIQAGTGVAIWRP